ncbi:MAG: ATP synthase F0 subunit C [Dehalococcoidales bacterium]|jgi:F-type H+-transporting ATPase subunit c|nr:ATP synthase F0 subunit C [Dehalococcoidales bacterium]MDD5604937.1 ATP synthase F0 subunit C [Dehalococcoidales bacterium]MDX9986037.1 ATP synthase F0 subunit C [Dehalococcoidales bacterium]NLE90439.1 ATP synthase F0 subunit C [Dehalococcoidales bacterium]
MELEAAKLLGAGLSTGLGMLGPGIGLGLIGANMLQGIARNPDARGAMFTNMILMAGLTEAVAIYALIVSILLIFVA